MARRGASPESFAPIYLVDDCDQTKSQRLKSIAFRGSRASLPIVPARTPALDTAPPVPRLQFGYGCSPPSRSDALILLSAATCRAHAEARLVPPLRSEDWAVPARSSLSVGEQVQQPCAILALSSCLRYFELLRSICQISFACKFLSRQFLLA